MAVRIRSWLTSTDALLAVEYAADPEFAEEWERQAVARLVAAQLIRHRSENGFSQRALAGRLGVNQPRVAELESGEKNPTLDTLVKIVAATGIEIAPMGTTLKLVSKAVRDTSAHEYAGASLLIAAR